jgi:hypothetical protein
VRYNPIRQFLNGMTTFEQAPQASANRIEGVNGIEIPDTLANGNNDCFTSNIAGDYGRIPGMADRRRI